MSDCNSSADGFDCSSTAENGGFVELPAPLGCDEEASSGVFPVTICGTIAITVFSDRTLHCKRQAKFSGLETLPGVAPASSQLKTFEGSAD